MISSGYKNKEAEKKWEAYRLNLKRSIPLPSESSTEKKARIKRLEANPEEWFRFYFPNYYSSEPAPFHVEATKRILKNDVWMETRAWSRELAKSTRGMMEDLYLALTNRAKGFLLVSHSNDNATELLMPYFINFESNPRIINDYGPQKNFRNWSPSKFVTRNGKSFRAIGAKENPRGTKNEEARPDVIRVDDIDHDKRTKNDLLMNELWEWVEQALIPTVSVSGKKRIIFQGNIIAKNSIIAKAYKISDYAETINIRDENGVSTWKKNSEEQIDWILNKLSYISQQKEYFNNPIKKGTVFTDFTYGKVPPLSKFQFLVAYGDPSPSNREAKNSSSKSVILMGYLNGLYYIIKPFLAQTKNEQFIEWYHDLDDYIAAKSYKEIVTYNYMENNSLQDPFYEQVYQPLMKSVAQRLNKPVIYISPDERSKPDKFGRIESNLDRPVNTGMVIFNEELKEDPHMKRLIEQFEAVEPTLSAAVDGPDCVEGGKYIIDNKIVFSGPVDLYNKKPSKNRY
jgi:hypothetical protein